MTTINMGINLLQLASSSKISMSLHTAYAQTSGSTHDYGDVTSEIMKVRHASVSLLLIYAVFFGEVNPHLHEFRLGLSQAVSTSHDVPAVLTDDVDELFRVVFDFLGSPDA